LKVHRKEPRKIVTDKLWCCASRIDTWNHSRYVSVCEQSSRAFPPASQGSGARNTGIKIYSASATFSGCPCSGLQSVQSGSPSNFCPTLSSTSNERVRVLERSCGLGGRYLQRSLRYIS
jgi:hypothetical protein